MLRVVCSLHTERDLQYDICLQDGRRQTFQFEWLDTTHNEHSPHDVLPQSPHPHAEHGPLIDHQITQDLAIQSHPELAWSRFRHFMREPCESPDC